MSEPGAGDDARGEGRGVEFVLGVEDQRGVHRPHPARRRRLAVQHVQEVPARGVVVRLDLDALSATGKSGASSRASSRSKRPAGRRCRARAAAACAGSSGVSQPSADTPVRSTSIGCAVDGDLLEHRAQPRRRVRAGPACDACRPRVPRDSAASRGSGDTRSPRIRRIPRCRGCRSRGSGGHCRCGRPCRSPCCRRRRRTGRRISSA